MPLSGGSSCESNELAGLVQETLSGGQAASGCLPPIFDFMHTNAVWSDSASWTEDETVTFRNVDFGLYGIRVDGFGFDHGYGTRYDLSPTDRLQAAWAVRDGDIALVDGTGTGRGPPTRPRSGSRRPARRFP